MMTAGETGVGRVKSQSDGHTDPLTKFSNFQTTLYSLKLAQVAKMESGDSDTGRLKALANHPALHFPWPRPAPV